MTVHQGAVLSANAGGRIVGKMSAKDALALLKEMKEMEALDIDRSAEILKESDGVNIHGQVRAVAGTDIMLSEEDGLVD